MKSARVTTGLDILALLLIAAGVGGGLWPYIHIWSLAVAGALIGAASITAALLTARKRPREDEGGTL